MVDWLYLLLALAAGFGIGIFYFGGLWLTVRQLPTARRPALLLLGSFLGRTTLAVAALYFAMDGQWQRLLACLLGFVLARFVMVRRLGARLSPLE